MPYTLPPIDQVPQLSRDDQTELLANLFEREATLLNLLIDTVLRQPHGLYRQLIEACRGVLVLVLEDADAAAARGEAYDPRVAEIIGAHPRLGGLLKVKTTQLSEHSSAEQKLLAGLAEETQKLIDLNDRYEATFPGLRFVCFVNGRPRPVIMEEMERRINRNDVAAERREAFDAMCDIAYDRAKKLGAE